MTACGNPVTSSAQVLNVARNPWAVIGRPLVGSIHFPPEALFILLMSVRSAMLEKGLL
jgi:hypothetical protein